MVEYYRPTDDDRELIARVLELLRRGPSRFEAAGAALDQDYSTAAIRRRQAEALRSERANPNYLRRSRAFRRKHFPYDQMSRQLGFTVSPIQAFAPPPKRSKLRDGKPAVPSIPCIERFQEAWNDTFDDATSLTVLEAEHCQKVAARRVLLAWLRLDPDRGRVRRITAFQELRTVPTPSGLPSAWRPDGEPQDDDDSVLHVSEDGVFGQDARNWLAKVKEAVNVLAIGADDATVDERSPLDAAIKANPVRWLADAMLLVREHPDWSNALIARHVGKSPGTLSRSKEFKLAASMARGDKTNWPKGHITVDSDSETTTVDGVAPTPVVGRDDQADRGVRIPGSRYFREYCAGCGEPIKVTQDKVGSSPVCNHCAD